MSRAGVRYLIEPGPVMSRTDGQIHRISAPVLANLYGLRDEEWRECDLYLDAGTTLPILRPRYDGNYMLPTEQP